MTTARLVRAIEAIARIGTWAGGVLMVAAAFLVFVEVIFRKAFQVSLGGADELSGYAFAIASTWAFSFALLGRAHIRIDVVYVLLPSRVRAFLDVLALAALGTFALLLAWQAWGAFTFSVQNMARANTPLGTPLWIPQSLWLLGLAFFGVTIIVQICRSASALLRGDLDEVHSVAGTRSVDDEIEAERAEDIT